MNVKRMLTTRTARAAAVLAVTATALVGGGAGPAAASADVCTGIDGRTIPGVHVASDLICLEVKGSGQYVESIEAYTITPTVNVCNAKLQITKRGVDGRVYQTVTSPLFSQCSHGLRYYQYPRANLALGQVCSAIIVAGRTSPHACASITR